MLTAKMRYTKTEKAWLYIKAGRKSRNGSFISAMKETNAIFAAKAVAVFKIAFKPSPKLGCPMR